MFWCQIEENKNLDYTESKDKIYYDIIHKFQIIQSKIFNSEPYDYDKPGKFIIRPAISELNDLLDEIDDYISDENTSSVTIVALDALFDNIKFFIDLLKNSKHYNDV